MGQTTDRNTTPEFTFRISNSLVIGLLALILLIITTSFSIIWFEGRPRLLDMNLDSQTKLGQNISLALERELREIRGVARSLAKGAKALPENNRERSLKRLIPSLLGSENKEGMIAGGGVWPEPYKFNADRARASVFWGATPEDNRAFFDDYNAPYSPGYHNEEWYVPAQYISAEEAYWSRSYTDPYTRQPMVTCSIPMRESGNENAGKGELIGVATVDIRLDKLSQALNKLMTGFDAYAFIIDRNNRFIVFPTLGFDVSRTQVYAGDNGFKYLADLAKIYPAFNKIQERIDALDNRLYEELSITRPEYTQLVEKITQGSYQIDHEEAKRIVAQMWLKERNLSEIPLPMDQFELIEDLLLRGKSTGFIYQMPSTGWRIVTVFEYRAYGGISELISKTLFGAILISAIAFGFVAFFLMKSFVLDRISRMVNMLSEAVQNKESESLKLEYESNDELGMLAYWFNKRSEQLEAAIISAEKANRAKSDFLAGMSQELRTPLHSIIGFNRRLIVKLGSELEDQNYKTLIAIQRSSNYLLSLIDDILEVSELEAGKVRLKYAWESVNLMLDDASSQMAGQMSDASIEFETETMTEDLRIMVDRQKVIQVLMHLLANALQTKGVGKIKLRAKRTKLTDQDAIEFSVKDTGAGISQEEKLKIYKQFSQAEDSTSIEKGMGLGLYVIREITALHNGAVYFDSDLNVGSEFRVVLPIRSSVDDDMFE